MIEKYTQEEFISSEEFKSCQDIYLNKYFLEDKYSLDDISDMTFYIYKINDEIIGFASFQDNEYLNILDMNFDIKWRYSDKQIELLNYILDNVKKENIYVHQSYEEDYEFYLKMDFELYKDYGDFFMIGSDVMRYSMNLKSNE
jgi:hypothetical protein